LFFVFVFVFVIFILSISLNVCIFVKQEVRDVFVFFLCIMLSVFESGLSESNFQTLGNSMLICSVLKPDG